MESLTAGIIESAIFIMVAVFIYILILRRHASPRFVRIYLLSTLVLVLFIPFIHIDTITLLSKDKTETARNMTTELATTQPIIIAQNTDTYTPGEMISNVDNSYNTVLVDNIAPGINHSKLILWIYIIGSLVLFLRLLFSINKLRLIKSEYHITKHNGIRVVIVGNNYQAFSFFSLMVIPIDVWKSEYKKEILFHEETHVRQLHSLDVILSEILLLVQWFNPFAWLYKRYLQENHEFLADDAVIKQGIPVKEYQKILLYKAMGQDFKIGNNFNSSLTKRRFQMMKLQNSKAKTLLAATCSTILMGTLCVVYHVRQKHNKALRQ